MIRQPLALAVALCLTTLLGSSAFAQDEKPLFNGKDLDGWEHVGPGRFMVENGVMKTEGGMGLLWYSRETFGDCVIRVVYKTGSPKANSGVYVRIADKPADPWFAVHNGFEVQIADNGSSTRGTGSVYTFSEAKAHPARPDQWNWLEITLWGSKIFTRINGTDVSEFDSATLDPNAQPVTGEVDPSRTPRPNKGYIGLQNHDDNSVVYFKSVSVRPIGPRDLPPIPSKVGVTIVQPKPGAQYGLGEPITVEGFLEVPAGESLFEREVSISNLEIRSTGPTLFFSKLTPWKEVDGRVRFKMTVDPPKRPGPHEILVNPPSLSVDDADEPDDDDIENSPRRRVQGSTVRYQVVAEKA